MSACKKENIATWINRVLPILFLCILLGCGAYLRFNKLDAWGLWEDEYITIDRISLPMKTVLQDNRPGIQSTQVYHFLMILYQRILSLFTEDQYLSSVNIRIPYAGAGVLSIIFMFLLGKKIINTWGGIFCAALVTFSYYHIYYSREARYYPFLYLICILTVLAAWLCINTDRNTIPWKTYGFYMLSSIAGLGIHQGYYFIFAVLTCYLGIYESIRGLYSVFYNKTAGQVKKQLARISIIYVFLIIPVGIWSPVLMDKVGTGKTALSITSQVSNTTLPGFTYDTILYLLKDFWRNDTIFSWIPILLISTAAVLLFSKKFHIVLWWLATLLLTTWYFSHASFQHKFHTKYVLYIAVLSLTVIGTGVQQYIVLITSAVNRIISPLRHISSDKNSYYTTVGAGILSCLIATLFLLAQPYNDSFKLVFKDYRKDDVTLFSFLESKYNPHDLVISYEEPWRGGLPLWIVYYQSLSPSVINIIRPKGTTEEAFVISPVPMKLFWIMGIRSYGSDTGSLRNEFIFYPFGSRMLIESKEYVYSKYQAVQLTQKLFEWYSKSPGFNDRIGVYGVIAGELQRWLNAHTANESFYTLLAAVSNAPVNVPLISEELYLADMADLQASNVLNGIITGRTYTGDPVVKEGSLYEKSISTHPMQEKLSVITFNNNFFYNRFNTYLFISGSNALGSVRFHVYGDGTNLFKSGMIKYNSSVYPVSVDISRVNILQLMVDPVKNNYGDHAIWGNPKLSYVVSKTYVADMTGISVTNSYSKASFGKTPDGMPLSIENDLYFKGIWIHAPQKGVCVINIPIQKKYNTFTTCVDVHNTNPVASVSFVVKGDDAILHDTGVIRGGDPPRNLTVPVSNIEQLELIVDPHNYNYYDHAVWGDPAVMNKPNMTYLADMPNLSHENIHGGLKRYKLYNGNDVIIDNKRYEKSLTTHTPVKGVGVVRCKLDGTYNRFRAGVCVVNKQKPGSVEFIVKTDNETVFNSGVLSTNESMVEIDVDISGVNELELIVNPGKDNYGDHAVWCDPRVIKLLK
jgi:hypothetical protein